MKVFKYEKPSTAYVFERVGDGDNFNDLVADVALDNGTVERVADDLVVIHINGGSFTLPIGFAVFPNAAGKTMYASVFRDEYGEVGADEHGVDELKARISNLETAVKTLEKGKGKCSKPAVDVTVDGGV